MLEFLRSRRTLGARTLSVPDPVPVLAFLGLLFVAAGAVLAIVVAIYVRFFCLLWRLGRDWMLGTGRGGSGVR